MGSAVGRNVLAYSRHHRPQEASATDEEAELFAGLERESDRQQVDIEGDDFARRELFDPVERVGRHCVSG
jgi:hypothetical protein